MSGQPGSTPMSDAGAVGGPASSKERSGSPVWWLVFQRELIDLWTGGRVVVLLILFALVMSVTSLLLVLESRLDPIPPVEMVYLVVLNAVSFGVFIGLVIGADSISGERERATLEPLLLAPVKRLPIVVGKLIAALSAWPAALLVALPYLVVLAHGNDSLGKAVLLGALLGGLLTVTFTGFAMVVSIWSSSNRVSLFVCLVVYLFFLIPTQFPTNAQKGDLGYLIQELNPLQATSVLLEKVLVSQRSIAEQLPYLTAVAVAALLVLGLLVLYAAPRMGLEGQAPGAGRLRWGRSATLLAVVGALVALTSLSMPKALAATSSPRGPQLEISVDLDHATVNVPDEVSFTSTVSNNGAVDSPPLTVAMNIVRIGPGEPVDPEDWSPQRTQLAAPLSSGGSTKQSWVVTAILQGDFMVYLTVIPTPSGPDTTTQPVAAPGIHLSVNGFTDTNPGGVLPVAIITPTVLILLALIPRRRRRRLAAQAVDQGAAS